ncbi:hypothetical protein [Oceanivirga miroungae]|uniref:Uncharacterized protein n=1 Tax=Oceanivirga miroungae TaxID=1130046 RepID=A0A6I8M740_9FUSO|nr:hypothetical protein [Oceanivirga miroungae]VWL85226.1 hypothetical protein OMES3154_00509 [Oceanivirga miroungae]
MSSKTNRTHFYNIYDSHIDLVFMYYPYNYKAKNQTLIAVFKLLKVYGETLDNKDKGKNLLHKLLLENRIKFLEVNEYGIVN